MFGIGAATNLIGSYLAAGASHDAAGSQADATNRATLAQFQAMQDALAFQKQAWKQGQQQSEPWVAAGRGAVNKLSYLMGVTPDHAPMVTDTPPTTGGYGPSGKGGLPVPGMPGGVWTGEIAVPRPGTSPGGPIPAHQPPTVPPPSHGGSPTTLSGATRFTSNTEPTKQPGPTNGATVLMRGPNGVTAPVPVDQVDLFKSLGCTVVNA